MLTNVLKKSIVNKDSISESAKIEEVVLTYGD